MSEHEESKKTLKHNGSKSKRKTSATASATTTATTTINSTTTTTDANNCATNAIISAVATVAAAVALNSYAQYAVATLPATQFSVQSSDVDGLRMKISAIRPNSNKTVNNTTITTISPISATTITTNSGDSNHKSLNQQKISSLLYKNNKSSGNNSSSNSSVGSSISIPHKSHISSLTNITTTTTAITTNSCTSSLIVKICKSQELKQQLDQLAKADQAKMPSKQYTQLATIANTTNSCSIISTSMTTKTKITTTNNKTTNSDHTESNISDATTTTVAGSYVATKPIKKVKMKRKKVQAHMKKTHKKSRVDAEHISKEKTRTMITTNTTIALNKMNKKTFTSDSEDEQPLIYRRLNKCKKSFSPQQQPQQHLHNNMQQQRAPRLLLTAINSNKSMSTIMPNVNRNFIASTMSSTILPPISAITTTALVGLGDHIGLSSSDNELPQLVSAAIERVAHASESEEQLAADDDAVAGGDDDDDDDDEEEEDEDYKASNRSSRRLKNRLSSNKLRKHKIRIPACKRRIRQTVPQYQSTLLQDFMEKTQRLGQNAQNFTATAIVATTTTTTKTTTLPVDDISSSNAELLPTKKRRGRPKKIQNIAATTTVNTNVCYTTTTTTTTTAAVATTSANFIESVDSGIVSMNSHTQSSTPSPRRNHLATTNTIMTTTVPILHTMRGNENFSWTSAVQKPYNIISQALARTSITTTTTTSAAAATDMPNKLDIGYLDKRIYATERVLYPPPRNKRRPVATAMTTTITTTPIAAVTTTTTTTTAITCNSENSKDDAHIDPMWRKIDVNKKFRRPSLSGYKSDGGDMPHHSTICSKILAAKSGYVSDYGSYHARAAAHNSGYKSDASCKSRYSTKSCMSRRSGKRRRRRSHYLGTKRQISAEQTKDEQDILQLAGLSLGHSSEESNEYVCKPNLAALPTTSVSKKYGEINRFIATGEYFGGRGIKPFKAKIHKKNVNDTGVNLLRQTNRKLKSRHSSAISLCSSYISNHSKSKRRHKRRCSRFSSTNRSAAIDSKLLTEIEILTSGIANISLNTLNALCNSAHNSKSSKDFGVHMLVKPREKRAQKKRKMSEHQDLATHSSNAGALTPSSKRRHKKSNSNSSPDDHKLPLKKRHYLLSGPGDKTSDAATAAAAAVAAKWYASNTQAWAAAAATAKSTACTKSQQQFCARVNKAAASAASPTPGLTPKKRHLLQTASLDPISLDIQQPILSNNSFCVSEQAAILGKKRATSQHRHVAESVCPPPGVFEPSVALEIQIPPITKLSDVAGIVTKSEVDSPMLLELNKNYASSAGTATPKTELPRVVETLLNKTGGNLLLRRKRRKINRTGFPTVRRKKRNINKNLLLDVTPDISAQVQRLTQQQQEQQLQQIQNEIVSSENMPQTANTVGNCLERAPRFPRVSVVSLERLQGVFPMQQEQCAVSPTGSVRGRKSERKSKHRETLENDKDKTKGIAADTARPTRGRRALKTVTDTNNCSINSVAKIKQEESQIALSPTPAAINYVTPTDAAIKCETNASSAKTSSSNSVMCSTPTTMIATAAARKTAVSPFAMAAQMRLPASVKLPAGLDPNTNFCCKIRLKRDAGLTPLVNINKTNNNNNNNLNNNNNYKEHNNFSKEEHIECEASVKNIEIDYAEHEPLPEDERENIEEATSITDIIELNDDGSGMKQQKKNNLLYPKKQYMVAGLFSDYYKTVTTSTRTVPRKKVHATSSIAKVSQNTNTGHSQLLPPPSYCEAYLRRTQTDFELPYNIWWAHKHSKLPVRFNLPCWSFRRIRTNCYKEVARTNMVNMDFAMCICKPDTGCGDNCLNRLVYTECSPNNCPTSSRCSNQRIQKHQVAPNVELFMTEHKGMGLRTKQPIAEGTYIREYVGEVVSEREFKRRMATIYEKDIHHYCLHLDGGFVIDGHRMGNEGRFVNHSCQPNCEMQKWSVNGLPRMALFAKREIEAGEELTYDYNFALFNPAEGQACKCLSPQCRGVIGGKSQRVKPLAFDTNVKSLSSTVKVGNNSRKDSKTIFCMFKDNTVPINQQFTEKEKKIIKQQRILLMRVYEKVRRCRIRKQQVKHNQNRSRSSSSSRSTTSSNTNNKRAVTPSLAAHISVLCSLRSMKTRGLTLAGQDPDLERMAKIAIILRQICNALETLKDPLDEQTKLTARALNMSTITAELNGGIPAKRKKTTKYTDLRKVRANIEQGNYQQPSQFDEDMLRLFTEARAMHTNNNNDNEQIHKMSAEKGSIEMQATTPLKALDMLLSAYEAKKHEHYEQLLELMGDEAALKTFKPTNIITKTDTTASEVVHTPQLPQLEEKTVEMPAVVTAAAATTPPQQTTAVSNLATSADAKDEKATAESATVMKITTSTVNTTPIKITPLSMYMHGNRKALRGGRSHVKPKGNANEDIIRCICGMYKDEGLMIQCAQCMVWQHTECTRADTKAERYLCERCEPRVVDREIPLDEYKEEGHRYYLTLMRGELHVRQGDTVYVLRDIPMRDADGNILASKKHTYETIGAIDYQECDIFRVERLWKDQQGQRFIFGHHFLRPHETFHEPTRRFYPNEVVRVPLYEVVPIELVIARCWVLDRTTFCKGRPIECNDEAHCYICELRVDKSARFFSKARINYPTCTKCFAFRHFPEKLKISKTYAPHDVNPAFLKSKKHKMEFSNNLATTNNTTTSTNTAAAAVKTTIMLNGNSASSKPTRSRSPGTVAYNNTVQKTKTLQNQQEKQSSKSLIKKKLTSLESVINNIRGFNKNTNKTIVTTAITTNTTATTTTDIAAKINNNVSVNEENSNEHFIGNMTTKTNGENSAGRGTRLRRPTQKVLELQLEQQQQNVQTHKPQKKAAGTQLKEKTLTKIAATTTTSAATLSTTTVSATRATTKETKTIATEQIIKKSNNADDTVAETDSTIITQAANETVILATDAVKSINTTTATTITTTTTTATTTEVAAVALVATTTIASTKSATTTTTTTATNALKEQPKTTKTTTRGSATIITTKSETVTTEAKLKNSTADNATQEEKIEATTKNVEK